MLHKIGHSLVKKTLTLCTLLESTYKQQQLLVQVKIVQMSVRPKVGEFFTTGFSLFCIAAIPPPLLTMWGGGRWA
jgi:hypothetical protein